jgi:hypothetical protein
VFFFMNRDPCYGMGPSGRTGIMLVLELLGLSRVRSIKPY